MQAQIDQDFGILPNPHRFMCSWCSHCIDNRNFQLKVSIIENIDFRFFKTDQDIIPGKIALISCGITEISSNKWL